MATISVEDLKKMKVNDLKKELKDRGLPVSGTKDVLLERMEAALDGTPVPPEDSTAEVAVLADDDHQDGEENVEKSIDQLVGDTAPAAPVESAPAAVTVTVTAKENIPKSDDEEAKKVVPPTGLSDAEKLKARAQKFGEVVSDSAKKQMRAERFGIQAPSADKTDAVGKAPAIAEDVDKLKKRAERFGSVVSNTLSKVDEDERKRKRLERFGPVTSSSTSPTEAKKVKLNSTDSDSEARKMKRAERFGLT